MSSVLRMPLTRKIGLKLWPMALSLALHTSALAAPLIYYALKPGADAPLPKGHLLAGDSSLTWIEIPQPVQKTPPVPAQGDVPVRQKPRPKVVQPEQPAPEAQASSSARQGAPSGDLAEPVVLGSPNGSGSGSLRYQDELFLLFESRKSYPQAARRLNQQGKVLISLRVWANGTIDGEKVVEASPYPRLNQAALGLVQQVGKFKPLPEGSGPYATFLLPIEYSIN